MSPTEALRWLILLRAGVVDGYDALGEEAFMLSEQFVHHPDADACREADFFIQFDIYV